MCIARKLCTAEQVQWKESEFAVGDRAGTVVNVADEGRCRGVESCFM